VCAARQLGVAASVEKPWRQEELVKTILQAAAGGWRAATKPTISIPGLSGVQQASSTRGSGSNRP
jgi:hypothetical protein